MWFEKGLNDVKNFPTANKLVMKSVKKTNN